MLYSFANIDDSLANPRLVKASVVVDVPHRSTRSIQLRVKEARL
jgi:hypothetical protein